MDASHITQPTVESRYRKGLFAALDEPALTRRGAAFVLVTAALLTLMWMTGAITRLFLAITFSGPEAARFARHAPSLPLDRLLGNMLIAFAVGALSGAAVRRLKWLAGPCVIIVVACASGLLWLGPSLRGVPISTHSDTLVHYHFRTGAMALVLLAGALLTAALGGTLAQRIVRRVSLRLGTSGALAWVAVVVLWSAFQFAWISLSQGKAYTDWDLIGTTGKLAPTAPFFLAAAWLLWTSGLGFWPTALIVGGAAVFQIVFGGVQIITGNSMKDVFEGAHWALRGLAAASAGAWVAAAALRREKPAAVALQGLGILAIVCVMAAIAGLASTLPSGFHVSR